MLHRLIDWCVQNKFLVVAGTLVAVGAGVFALRNTPLDAIPDLSDPQVIIRTDWEGRSPVLVEDQITYPLVSRMLAAPRTKAVRGVSMFGDSFVFVIFKEGTDLYWARSRVLEYLSQVAPQLPSDAQVRLGPDATGVGWVYQYALVDTSGKHSLADLRSFQDWYLRYWLQSVDGVAEVASIGGFERQYQVEVDPNRLIAYNIGLRDVVGAIKSSNMDVSGRTVEMGERQYFVIGKGYIQQLADLENVVVKSADGTPVLLRDLGRVTFGPQIRTGIAELDGQGEAVGGIVVMRHGENAYRVIQRVKDRIEEVKGGFPEGVKVVPTYDRSKVIGASIETLTRVLIEELVIVSLVIIVFLWHFRSALAAIVLLPLGVLLAFIPMSGLGITSNIMSLGGIAIAVGAMVDAAVVMIENAHKQLERAGPTADRTAVIVAAVKQVGRPIFFALLVITISFLPVFTLVAQEGRLFKPLAFTKTFAMFFAAMLSVTIVPVLMVWSIRGRLLSETRHPISRALHRVYEPVVRWVLRHPAVTVALAVLSVMVTAPVVFGLRIGGRQVIQPLGVVFMPDLYEGDLLAMPTAFPGIPIETARRTLQLQDAMIKQVPEVERVFGKMGRSNTATDMAPLEMTETSVMLKPDDQWREEMKSGFGPWRHGDWQKLRLDLQRRIQIPGWPNWWLMPIKTRIDMVTTGARTDVTIKILGRDIDQLARLAAQAESLLRSVPGTGSIVPDPLNAGYYLDIIPNRAEAARYGLTVGEINEVIETAIGGKTLTTTVEGPERYTVIVRYPRDLRADPKALRNALISTPAGTQVPLGQLATIRQTAGPPVIRNEQGQRAAYVQVDVNDRDLGGYVTEAQALLTSKMHLPPGYSVVWSGFYENIARVRSRMLVVVPLTLLLIFFLLYLNFRGVGQVFIRLLSIPFGLVGSFWFLALMGYDLSVATIVGLIAMTGVAVETGIVMLVYLDEAFDHSVAAGRMTGPEALREAIVEGAVQRVRPKMMTVLCLILGLLPLMWSTGIGSDVAKPIAAPMVGGLLTSAVDTLIFIPAIYYLWKIPLVRRLAQRRAATA